ncbi:MAG: RNA polymerase sporulation sigma factor SigG [Clostridia bacterium]|nr:RNA polymerase sporulation sigma factor SigG [Clostridia bacterium]
MFNNHKVVICGVNTADLKVLTEEEKQALMLRIRAGDKEARKDMICGNLRLVLSLVQRFAGRKENLDDLFQVGCIGLVKAVDNFDVSKEVMFSTYAVPMIIGEMRRYLRDSASVRVSRSVRDLAYRALQIREELAAEFSRDPTPDEIAARVGAPRERVVAAMDAIVEPISLYEPVFSENGDALYVIDQLSDTSRDASDESWLENIALREAVATLSPREQNIIKLRYFKDKTQMEIASEIGISQAQVSRLEKAALQKLKKQL